MTLAYSEENALQHELLGTDDQSDHRRFLDDVGDGSGTKEMNVAADIFYLAPDTGEIYVIDEIRIAGADASVLNPGGFLGTAALTNGILIRKERVEGSTPAIVVEDLLNGLPIKTNAGLMDLGDGQIEDGAASCFISVGMKLRENGHVLKLDGNRGERLAVQTLDSMAAYIHLRVSVYMRQYVNV
jgi:hypothetical protein